MESSNMVTQLGDPDTDSEREEMETIEEDEVSMDLSTILKYQQEFRDLLIKEEGTESQKASQQDCEATAGSGRQKQIASGWAIYESATARLNEIKAESYELLVNNNKLWKHHRCNTFDIEEYVANLEVEAKGTRLEARTNHKRARSISFQDLENHNRLLECATGGEHGTLRTVRSRSVELDSEVCDSGRKLHSAGDIETETRTGEGYARDDMSERSSGTTRRTRSSLVLTSEDSEDLQEGADTSGTLEEEVAESAVADEAVYILGSSKRIRPEDVQQSLEKEDKSPGISESQKKEIDASPTTGRYQQSAQTSKADSGTRRSRWAFGQRYNDPKLNCLPDYGPSARLPATLQEAEAAMPPHIPGGFKPVNRLGNRAPNPPYKQPKPGATKAFDLTSAQSRGQREEHELPNKRRRIEDPDSIINGSSRSPIDLDGASAHSTKQSVLSSTRSGHSQPRDGTDRSGTLGGQPGLPEARKVDKLMRVNSRNRKESSGHGKFQHHGSKQFVHQGSVMRLDMDEPSDPIIDGDHDKDYDLEILPPLRLDMPANRRSNIQVQIPYSANTGSTTGYKGTSHLKPSRTQGTGIARKLETGELSRHFNSKETARITASTHPGWESSQGASARQAKQSHEKHLEDLEADELSSSHYAPGEKERYDKAENSLSEGASRREPSTRPKSQASNPKAVDLSDVTDDEADRGKDDIKPSNFVSSKSKKKNVTGEDEYNVVQLFSPAFSWLLSSQEKVWRLLQNSRAKLLSFRDEQGRLLADLQLNSGSILKIERCREIPKVIVHKSVDPSAKRANQICLEFCTNDETSTFIERMKKNDPTIGEIIKNRDHVDKVFKATKSLSLNPQKKVPVIERAEDLQLLESNARKRTARETATDVTYQAGRRTSNGQRLIDQFQETTKQDSRLEADRKLTRERASFEDLNAGGPLRHHKDTEVRPDEFYNRSSRAKVNGESSHGTRSAARLATSNHSLPASRQSPRQRRRSPTPEPNRWTSKNPDWVIKKNWKSSVLYPPNRKNKATVDLQDIPRLDEGEFLNDNLVEFYLRWLEEHLEKERPDLASRIYFLNTFFYERLTKHGKGKSGGINYEAVERWTSKVDLLKYDYIVVPVNETVHWYVAIICNAPKLLKQPDEEKMSQPEATCNEVVREPSYLEKEKHVSVSPPKSSVKTLPDEVDDVMKEMTLEDKEHEEPRSGMPGNHLSPIAPSEEQKDTDVLELDPPPATVVSDLTEPKPIQGSQTRRTKRKSTPAPRKYNPEDPRIITLDSLGLSHSPTCINLRKYLLQEIKAKKGIEIIDPGSLGMTAKNIPQQDNHCDCGLFLLAYMEEFLKRPDEFVHDILQQNEQDFKSWRSASDMRAHIRELLFELQEKQVKEAELLRREKAKKKQTAKLDKHTSASTSKSTSGEASKSARSSISPEKIHPLSEVIDRVLVGDGESPHVTKEASSELHEQLQTETEPQSELSMASPLQLARGKSENCVPERSNKPGLLEKTLEKTLSMVASAMSYSRSAEEKEDLTNQAPHMRTSLSQPITIEDSQDMDGDPRETSAETKQAHVQQSKRSPTNRSTRVPHYSGSDNAKEVAACPEDEPLEEAVYPHHHPLPDSDSEQGEVQLSRTLHRSIKDTTRRGTEYTKAANRVKSYQDSEAWSGNENPKSSENIEVVQLPNTPARKLRYKALKNEGQESDEKSFPKVELAEASPPPDVSFLSSPDVVQQSFTKAHAQSRDKATTIISPHSVKRPSSHGAEHEPRSSKRRKDNDVVDLSEDSHSRSVMGIDSADVAMINAYSIKQNGRQNGRHTRFS